MDTGWCVGEFTRGLDERFVRRRCLLMEGFIVAEGFMTMLKAHICRITSFCSVLMVLT
jgi:hypothetical protein